MAKDTYYFSHDYNARNDRKIAALVRDYKSSGYGIFWATCEMMHEEGGELEFDDITVGCIAKDLNETPDLIIEVLEKCISNYRLFTKQIEAERSKNILLRSGRIDRNLITKKDKKEAKAKSGRLGGIKSGESRRNKETNEAKRSTASSNEANKIKGNEIKEIIIQGENLWFLKYYHSSYDNYKNTFNGQSTTESYFKEWKEFIDFIYQNKYEDLFNCKFVSPHSYASMAAQYNFTKEKWGDILTKILATGIKPEHDLFFRIPQFMKYGNGLSNKKEIELSDFHKDMNAQREAAKNKYK